MEILTILIETLIVGLFINLMLKPKYSKIIMSLLLAGFIILFSTIITIVNIVFHFEILASGLYFVLTIVYSVLFFKGQNLTKILFAVLPLCVVILTNIIVATFTPIIFSTTIEDLLAIESEVRLISLVLAKTLQFILTGVALIIFKKNHFGIKRSETSWFMIIFLMSGVAGIFVFAMAIELEGSLKVIYLMTVTISLVLINFLMVMFYIRFIKNSKAIYEYEKSLNRTQNMINTAIEMQEADVKLRTLKHDIAGQIDVLRKLPLHVEQDAVKEYLTNIENTLSPHIIKYNYINISNKPLNAIINSYIKKCDDQNIDFECHVLDIDSGSIVEFELCSVVINLLDNAITAVNGSSNPQITFQMKNQRAYLAIKCKNNYDGEVSIQNGDIMTTKENHADHGYGIKSIKTIVKKYDGMINIETMESEFKVNLLLKT